MQYLSHFEWCNSAPYNLIFDFKFYPCCLIGTLFCGVYLGQLVPILTLISWKFKLIQKLFDILS